MIQQDLYVYNSLTRQRERFSAIEPPHVGMYVCGPTVYGDPHLGHARTALAFDVVFRHLQALGYTVRYVRNITDVGHLEDEAAETGEDKVAKRARLERIEPMEVVQRYTLSYHEGIRRLNCLPPSIEPTASGHIIEQIQVIERIFDAGLAYEQDGSVYFDLQTYAKEKEYGKLSGKVLDDLLSNTRGTVGSSDKRSSLDFALWKRAEPGHIMRWPSPWGEGFPGWHLECTTMSTKYLGKTFDIHGGGLDLQFPHHEAEIAQNHGAFGTDPARYWLHSNMLTVGGQKMAKSLGNFITLEQMYTGEHPELAQAYHPMVLRFFMLQSHYRSTLDFSNEALQAAEKGYVRLMAAVERAQAITRESSDRTIPTPPELGELGSEPLGAEVGAIVTRCWESMNDDFHTPRTIAALFDLARIMQSDEFATTSDHLRQVAARGMSGFANQILGLQPRDEASGERSLDGVMNLLLQLRKEARDRKDYATSDTIRDELSRQGIRLEDRKDGTTTWVKQ